jgi:hypothetical protein
MVIAFIAVLAVVVVVARGRGGELSVERSDYAPLDVGPVSATDVALLRPPTGIWGYSMQATDEALEQIAEAIRERDVRIVALEQLVTDLSREQEHAPSLAPLASPYASPYSGARHRRTVADTVPDAVTGAPYRDAATGDQYRDSATGDQYRDSATGDQNRDAATGDPYRATYDVPTEPARLPFDLPGPGDSSGPPPEQSHD